MYMHVYIYTHTARERRTVAHTALYIGVCVEQHTFVRGVHCPYVSACICASASHVHIFRHFKTMQTDKNTSPICNSQQGTKPQGWKRIREPLPFPSSTEPGPAGRCRPPAPAAGPGRRDPGRAAHAGAPAAGSPRGAAGRRRRR